MLNKQYMKGVKKHKNDLFEDRQLALQFDDQEEKRRYHYCLNEQRKKNEFLGLSCDIPQGTQ